MSNIRELLLAKRLAPERVAALLRPYGFRDPLKADRELQSLAEDPQARQRLASIVDDLLMAASDSADPDGALSRFERFVRAAGSATRVFSHLESDPRMIDVLLRTFGASPFLGEILIRQPGWMYWLSEPGLLDHARKGAAIKADLARALVSLRSEDHRRAALRVAKRREILHIGVRDLLRLSTVTQTLTALSELAEALIGAALDVASAGLRESLGIARDPPEKEPRGFVVLGMGKLGGGELNFSSDVDLVYVYDTDRGRIGRGAKAPSRGAYFQALARRLTIVLADLSEEGYVYRVDLRLRPEGSSGSVALPLPAFARYYRTRAATWERLALLKAWPAAGDRALGARCLARTRAFVFGRPFADAEMDEVRGLKRQIDRKVGLRHEQDRHVKLGVGGIREIELVVQVMQARFGRRRPGLRQRGTLAALDALARAGVVSPGERQPLVDAYLFLRDLENKLQMVADAQVHVLPEDPEAVRACALRLGYRDRQGIAAGEALLEDYRRHTSAVHRCFEQVIGVAG
jgi:glutamate-ammonia-ligase adenylyltransferase